MQFYCMEYVLAIPRHFQPMTIKLDDISFKYQILIDVEPKLTLKLPSVLVKVPKEQSKANSKNLSAQVLSLSCPLHAAKTRVHAAELVLNMTCPGPK